MGLPLLTFQEQALWDVYMEPFYRTVMDGEAGTVMASYNTINGTYSTQNKRLLTDSFKGKTRIPRICHVRRIVITRIIYMYKL